MDKLRKSVIFRLANHKQRDILNEWLNNQDNIQDSITNVILHIIDQYGMCNITDFEVQKAMHQRGLVNQPVPTVTQSTQPVISKPVVHEAPVIEPSNDITSENEQISTPVKEEKSDITSNEKNEIKNQADPDDPFAAIDVNNL